MNKSCAYCKYYGPNNTFYAKYIKTKGIIPGRFSKCMIPDLSGEYGYCSVEREKDWPESVGSGCGKSGKKFEIHERFK